jgi:hypothetical protein
MVWQDEDLPASTDCQNVSTCTAKREVKGYGQDRIGAAVSANGYQRRESSEGVHLFSGLLWLRMMRRGNCRDRAAMAYLLLRFLWFHHRRRSRKWAGTWSCARAVSWHIICLEFRAMCQSRAEKAWMLGELRLCRVALRDRPASLDRVVVSASTRCQQRPPYKAFQEEIRRRNKDHAEQPWSLSASTLPGWLPRTSGA